MSDCIQMVSEKLDDGTKNEAGDFIAMQHIKQVFCNYIAISEVVKRAFQKMVDVKLLQQVKLSTGDTETDDMAPSKFQLPPIEGF